MCCPSGIILPFVLHVAWLGPVMEDVIREVSPELVEKIRQVAPKFFANLLRFHNHFTGEAWTTEFNPREFCLAQQLVDSVFASVRIRRFQARGYGSPASDETEQKLPRPDA